MQIRALTALALLALVSSGCEERSKPYLDISPPPSSTATSAPSPHGDPSAGFVPGGGNAPRGTSAPGARSLGGRVLETFDSEVGSYTYAKLALPEGGEAWVAGPRTPIRVGELVEARDATLQKGFPTRTRVFDEIWLAMNLGVHGSAAAEAPSLPSSSAAVATEPVERLANGQTIAEIRAERARHAGQTVRVRGRITRVSPMVDGRWVHLSDGSGPPEQDDLTFIVRDAGIALEVGAVTALEGRLTLDHEMAQAHRPEALVVENAVPAADGE